MKHFFKLTILASVVTALIFGLSAFKTKQTSNVDAYSIELVSNSSDVSRGSFEWTWILSNPNPGNGNDGTLQNVSHFDITLSAQAEGALLSAEYSFDGINWVSLPIEIERDPSIRACTTVDVLKFNAGTVGSEPTYYRATFSEEFSSNPFSTSWIKSGNRTGCNLYYFAGVGTPKLD